MRNQIALPRQRYPIQPKNVESLSSNLVVTLRARMIENITAYAMNISKL